MSLTGELQHYHETVLPMEEKEESNKNKRNSTKLDSQQVIKDIQRSTKREIGKENNQLNQLKRQIDELNPNSQRTRTMKVYSNKQSPTSATCNNKTTNEIELQLKIELDK